MKEIVFKEEIIGSKKSKSTTEILCFFFGIFGLHRFYVGKIGTGFLWLFTLGFLGIGVLVDFLLILNGKFKDKEGMFLKQGS